MNADQIKWWRACADRNGITPANCPHCEYDRGFPDTAGGGWIYTGNNGPTVACPMCNADERFSRAHASAEHT